MKFHGNSVENVCWLCCLYR